MCYAAVANNYNAYKFVPRNMKSERKLMHLAITPMGGGQNLQYGVPEGQVQISLPYG